MAKTVRKVYNNGASSRLVSGRVVSHLMDLPIAHPYCGTEVSVKFYWRKPNDEIPTAAHLVAEGGVEGLGIGAVDLVGPRDDYSAALAEAMAAAEQWIDSQLP